MGNIRLKSNYIYHLINDGVVIYVGRTRSLLGRLGTHNSDHNKIFNSVEYFSVPSESMSITEFAHICHYLPPQNIALPVMKFSIRECAVMDHNKKLGRKAKKHRFYDISKPDRVVTLNGKNIKVWAKKGVSDDFNKLNKDINDIIENLKHWDDVTVASKLMSDLDIFKECSDD